MALDHSRTATLEIDDQRTVTVIPVEGAGITLGVEDPTSVAIVEMTMGEVDALIEILQRVSHDPR